MSKKLFQTISYVNLYSHDNRKAICFYRDLLGIGDVGQQSETAEELEAMNQHLEKMNITLFRRSEKMSYGTITNFLDPDGNLLEILLEN